MKSQPKIRNCRWGTFRWFQEAHAEQAIEISDVCGESKARGKKMKETNEERNRDTVGRMLQQSMKTKGRERERETI